MYRKLAFLSLFVLLCGMHLFAQLTPETVAIPMRDGKSLAADIYRPNDSDVFPTILVQTPYNKNNYRTRGLPLGIRQELENSNYAFVILDWRCFYESTDACVAQPDRGKDGYDAVEWIAAQSWSNGKVATWGPSALGNIQFNTAYEAPPHLVCAVPEVCSPQTAYNDYYPGGVLIAGRVTTLNKLYGGAFTTVIDNPYYNNVWNFVEKNTISPELISVPMLLVAGWYDHNSDVNLNLINVLENSTALHVRHQHKILIGPWVHGGTGEAYVGSINQGELTYPEAAFRNHAYELAFLDYHVREINNGWEDTARVTYFQMGDNVWKKSSTFPAESTVEKKWYLSQDGRLQLEIPADGLLTYAYDPENPSPSLGGKTLTPGLDQGPLDQTNGVENRNDVLIFTSETLSQDITLHGKSSVSLFVTSDKTDTDFMLRLTEVYPDGRSMLLSESALRMRYRNGITDNEVDLMTPNNVYAIDMEFDALATTFKAGNKIRLIISSSNYPHYNRNMNTGEAMYPNSNPDTLVNPLVANNTVYFGPNTPSFISLNVLENQVAINDVENIKTVEVFPNPSSGVFKLKGLQETKEISVYSSTGKLVFQSSLQTNGILDLKHLENGAYNAILKGKNAQSYIRLLITK